MRVNAQDLGLRRVHAINIAVPSMEPHSGRVTYDSALVDLRAVIWGYYNFPAVDGLFRLVRNSFAPAEPARHVGILHNILIEQAALVALVHDLNPRTLSARCQGFVQARSWFQDYTQIGLG